MRRKRCFTLLEVLIALVLSFLIMGVLLFYYMQMSRSAALSDQATVRAFEMRYLQNRLRKITLALLPLKESTFFFSGGSLPTLFLPGTQNLIFSYDNGIVFDHNLSGTVTGRLYVDLQGALTLMTWTARNEWEPHTIPHFHREVLAEKVQEFEIEFLPGAKASTGPPKNPELLPGQWAGPWKKEYKELPAAIRFKITKGGKTETLSYPILGPQTKVIFRA